MQIDYVGSPKQYNSIHPCYPQAGRASKAASAKGGL